MAKVSTLTNVWSCDNCGTTQTVIQNPFYAVHITLFTTPLSTDTIVDLCQTCISSINLQPIANFLNSIPE